jgi:hypothetical protein
MPKLAKYLKCLTLRNPIDFIKRRKQGMSLYPLADLLFFMLKISDVYNKDGASLLRRKGYEGQERHHNFRHFRHFSGLSGLGKL